MGLFHRRYLSVFCFAFLFVSLLLCDVENTLRMILIVLFLVAAVAAVICAGLVKKYRFNFLVISFLLLFSLVAAGNSYLFIGLPRESAQRYEGEHEALVRIVSLEEKGKDSSEYIVRIKRVGEDKTDIKARLFCEFSSDFSYGNVISSSFRIEKANERYAKDKDIMLHVFADTGKTIYFGRGSADNHFLADAIERISRNIRISFSGYVDELYGSDSALLKGFLISDRSDISQKVNGDFRRTGTSHLLSVSGLHVAVLLGAVEVLLRKLFVPKKARCIAISVLAIFYLALTDFSASAVRSVLMLLLVYLSFMLFEDVDSVTSLFVSIAFIVLVSPFSVYDLGMWMSFFATLGLLTVYSFLEKRLPKPKSKSGIKKRIFSWIMAGIRIMLMTLVANVFLLPISWCFFGEISLVSMLVNLATSSISTLYLMLGAISLLCGFIPYVGVAIIWVTKALGSIMLFIISEFAALRGAVISLRFDFVPILMALFIISFAVLMIVDLKRKILICVPAAAFGLAFAACISVFLLTAKPDTVFCSGGNSDFLISHDGLKTSVLDVSDASSRSKKLLLVNVGEYTTEIESYIITDVQKKHPDFIESLLTKMPIRRIYLPMDTAKVDYIRQICKVAEEYRADVSFYNSGQRIEIFASVRIAPFFQNNNGSTSVFAYLEGEGTVITYSDKTEDKKAFLAGAKSSYFLFGEHSKPNNNSSSPSRVEADTKLIFSSEERYKSSAARGWENRKYILDKNSTLIKYGQ